MAEIRILDTTDIMELLELYRGVFAKHRIFVDMPKAKAMEYIQDSHGKALLYGGGYFVAVEDGKVIGGIFVEKELDGVHTRWKIKHVAVSKDHTGKGVGHSLLAAAEGMITESIQKGRFESAKIEISVAQEEKDALPFYKKAGYKLEGTLANHYRYKEDVYVLGKTIAK